MGDLELVECELVARRFPVFANVGGADVNSSKPKRRKPISCQSINKGTFWAI